MVVLSFMVECRSEVDKTTTNRDSGKQIRRMVKKSISITILSKSPLLAVVGR